VLNVAGCQASLKFVEDISEFILDPQRPAGSTFGVVLAVVAVLLASGFMLYLLRCYVQERRIRKRVRQRAHRQFGGNIVPAQVLSETRRLRRKSSSVLPAPHRNGGGIKLRRRSRGPHPWKQDRFQADSPTPH
jgi:hypothetical protein